tara:strand:+ start:76 stop:2445 length:2370 start_codon:yes stop_codon:yes gene_type:complete
MASTYVNNLRLNEMATGDASGTWGTTTNTNLELIGEALGYGTEAITTNADTHTSTVADGASDAARAMYVKYTGTLDSTCTITIAPNTMKRVQIIENATSGSQSIIIKQGTGATVTIPTGRVSVVYLDGAGSGAAVVNAFTDLDLAGTLSIAGNVAAAADMTVGDDLTLSSDAGVLGFGADTDVTLTHVADTGLLLNSTRQLQFGDSGTYIHQSADGVLDLVSDTEIEINATTIDINGAVDISGNALVSGEVQTANIGYTDGDNAITIADGGGITAANGITSTAAANTFGATSFNDADITNVGSIALDTITNDGTDITLDSSGDIILDADGDNIFYKAGGSSFYSISNVSGDSYLGVEQSDKDLVIRGNDGGSTITALTLDMSDAGAATFNGVVTADAGVKIDNITIDGTEIDLSSGSLTIDAHTDIILDADSGVWRFKDDGTTLMQFAKDGATMKIYSAVSDADIIFQGNDGGSTVNALTLDMSAAGAATFNNKVTATELEIATSASDVGVDLTLNGNKSSNGAVASITFENNTDSVSMIRASRVGGNNDAADLSFFTQATGGSNSERMRIRSDGGVAIGLENDGYSSQILSVKAGSGDEVLFGESTDANCFASFRDNSSSANIEFGAIANAHILRSDTTVRIRVDGDGLKFGSDTAAANALDDYEIGTWTPTLIGSTTNPVYGTSTAVGDYVKVGDIVHATFLIIVTSVSNVGAGNKSVDGLPFTNNQNSYQQVGTIGYNDVWADAVTRFYMTGGNLTIMPTGVTQSNYTGDVTTGYFAGQISFQTSD